MKLGNNTISKRPLRDVIGDIIRINRGIADFWSRAHGWAPEDVTATAGLHCSAFAILPNVVIVTIPLKSDPARIVERA